MGLRGPLPKTTSEKRYEGNPSRRPLEPIRHEVVGGKPERPKGMSAGARRLWDLYAPDLASKHPFRAAWVPGLMGACEFEADLLQDERRHRQNLRKQESLSKASGNSQYVKTAEDRLEKRELMARRRVLAQMKEQLVLTPRADSRLPAVDVFPQQHQSSGAISEDTNDRFSVVQ